ncbi:hypothetical protein Tco_1002521 [Tanacetum coccineum]|uniref:Uncharacterized protein n=1 Tax=Tanacetum coccineum TaxID=301880 RepID=A0ABQ5F7V6_9ASTR
MHTVAGEGVASIKQHRHDLYSDGVRNFATASERGRLKEDLESPTWRRSGGNLKGLSAEEAWEAIEDCAQCNKQWKNPTSTISDQTIANLKDQLVGNEVVRVKIPSCMSWLDAYDEPLGDLDMVEDKVDDQSPQSTPQVLSPFEVYTPPVTYPKEVEESLGTPMEEEPLDQTKLKDLGLTNHVIPFSYREIPNFDELEPQSQPFPGFSSLEVDLGEERGP